jgi:hypothetical protein
MSAAAGSLLAQTRPSGTSAALAYTATLHTEITRVVICNTTGAAADASLFHDDSGTTYNQTTALLYGTAIAAYSTLTIDSHVGSGFMVKPSGKIAVQTSVGSALTFSFYGITEDISTRV